MATTITHSEYDEDLMVAMARETVADGPAGDLGAAFIFKELFDGWLVFDHSVESWYAFQPDLWWVRIEDDSIKNVAMAKLSEIYTSAARVVFAEKKGIKARIDGGEEGLQGEEIDLAYELECLNKESSSLKNVLKSRKVLEAARSMSGMSTNGSEWDSNGWLLGVENGVVDMRADAVERFRCGLPEDMITKVAPASWDYDLTDEAVGSSEYVRFLTGLFADDSEDIVDYMKRVFGSYATGIVTDKVWNILHGPGGDNGKTTFMELLGAALGPYAVSSHKTLVTKKDHGKTEMDATMFKLRGARLVWISETERSEPLDLGGVKFLTGKDTITCRPPYGQLVSWRPTHHIVLSTNHKPKADSTDDPFWNRTVLIPFNLKFCANPTKPNERKLDSGIMDRVLHSERSIVLRWLVDGALEWQSEGLDVPECLRAATQEYRDEQDRIGRWLKEDPSVVQGDAYKAYGGELYQSFKHYEEHERNLSRALSSTDFGKELKKRFEFNDKLKRITYFGIAIISETSDGPKEDAHLLTMRALGAALGGDMVLALTLAQRIDNHSDREILRKALDKIAMVVPGLQNVLEIGTPTYDTEAMVQRLEERKG